MCCTSCLVSCYLHGSSCFVRELRQAANGLSAVAASKTQSVWDDWKLGAASLRMDFNSPPRPSKVLPGVGSSVLMPWFRILVLPQSAIDVQAQLSNHCSVSTPCEESRRLLLDLLICVVLHRSGHLFRVKAGTFFDCSIGHSSNPCSKLCGPLPATYA